MTTLCIPNTLRRLDVNDQRKRKLHTCNENLYPTYLDVFLHVLWDLDNTLKCLLVE